MALKQKNLKEVVDTLSPLLFIKFFDISIFLGHRKVPLRSFLVFWDNKLFTRNRDTTLLGIKYFVNWHFLKHRRFPLLNIGALSEKTSLKENPDFLKQKFFPIPEFSDRLRASTTKILALRQKKLTEIHDTPSPLSMKTSDIAFFQDTEGFPIRCFSVLWDNKLSTGNRDIFLIGIKFSVTRTVLKHRRVILWKSLVQWDKTTSTEYRDSRPRSYPKTFSIPETLCDKEGFLYEIFRHRQTKQFRRKTLI